MSMTDEGAMSSNQSSAKQSPDKNASQGAGAGQSGGNLPGLAAFGQMQGYTPVGHQSGQPSVDSDTPQAPEAQAVPQDIDENASDETYAEQFAEEFVREFNQSPETAPEPQPEGPDHAEGFSSEEIQNYMTQQYAAPEPQDYDAVGNGHEAEAAYHHGDADAAPYETGGALKTFEAHYDQHPEIPLGAFDEPGGNQDGQPFFQEGEQAHDADFLGGESVAGVAEPKERRGRKALMAASGLIGVLALGGALAFAYKIGGDSDIARTGEPPLIQADSRPVKVAPDNPGGKEFPHANKKIYERLGGGGKSEEVVKLKPRQEDVAAAATAAINSDSQAAGQPNVGGPRKVKTLTVRPDGTIEMPDSRQKVVKAPPPASEGPVATAPDGTIAMSFPSPSAQPQPKAETPKVAAAPAAPSQAATPPPVAPTIPQAAEKAPQPTVPQQASAGEAPAAAAPPPVQKPAAPRVAAAAPAAATPSATPAPAASSGGSYVVQVAARKSQTDALAAFADIQQKYPRLLDGYRPIIKRADLGNKGVWYRLNVGPVESKKVASSLCSQLKSAGMRSCLIRAQ